MTTKSLADLKCCEPTDILILSDGEQATVYEEIKSLTYSDVLNFVEEVEWPNRVHVLNPADPAQSRDVSLDIAELWLEQNTMLNDDGTEIRDDQIPAIVHANFSASEISDRARDERESHIDYAAENARTGSQLGVGRHRAGWVS